MARFRRAAAMTAAAMLLTTVACESLDIQNPNEPDARRALANPATIGAIAQGTFQSWFNTHQGMLATGPLTTMADSYTASWNNYNMRLYSSEPRTAWENNPAAAARTSIEWYWYGYYSALSSASDVLTAIRKNNVVINTATETKMVEAMAVMMQGMTLGELSLNYDKAFIVDDKTEPAMLPSLQFSPRAAIRDAALAKLQEAITLASATSFTAPKGFTNGTTLTSAQVVQLANTLSARYIAYFPRNAAENGAADWTKVASFASKGISSGNAWDFGFTGDGCNAWCDELKLWSNDITTMRMDTRVANLMDPVTQKTPWPKPNGNPPPNSADKRLADGTTGTDYRWDGAAIFRPARGQYHQSNIGHVRYEYASFNDASGGGYGKVPVVSATENDLLWAEGLIRSNGNLVTAAQLINNTRVGRGGLTPAAGTAAQLIPALQYEQEVELPGLGAVPYFNRRRLNGLQALTPAQMPVPAKELGVLQQELYTFGGTSPQFELVPNGAQLIFSAMLAAQRAEVKLHAHN